MTVHHPPRVYPSPPAAQVVAAVLKSMLEEGRAAGLKGFEQVWVGWGGGGVGGGRGGGGARAAVATTPPRPTPCCC